MFNKIIWTFWVLTNESIFFQLVWWILQFKNTSDWWIIYIKCRSKAILVKIHSLRVISQLSIKSYGPMFWSASASTSILRMYERWIPRWGCTYRRLSWAFTAHICVKYQNSTFALNITSISSDQNLGSLVFSNEEFQRKRLRRTNTKGPQTVLMNDCL